MLTGLTMKAQVDLQNGLIGNFPFNGNANDESVNGKNAIVNGATLTTDRFGTANSAYNFDGIASGMQSPGFLTGQLTQLSFSVWIMPNQFYSNSDNVPFTIFVGQNSTLGGYSDLIGRRDFYGVFPFGSYTYVNYGNQYDCPASLTTTLNPNSWYHLVAIRDGATMRFYVNGILEGTNTYTSVPDFWDQLSIGAYYSTDQPAMWFYNGKIDDIHVYNRAINDQEIQALYNIRQISFDNQTVKAGRTIEIPIKTTDLQLADNFISYQFDYNYDNTQLEYVGYDLAGTIAIGGNVTINTTGNNKLTVGYTTQTALQGAGDIIKLKFRVLDSGTISPTITNFKFNETPIVNITNGIITSTLFYGDVTANDEVSAYDAALVLQYSVGIDPMPTIDILPWESWRLKVADVDGNVGITANDASEILKYTVGLINTFAVSKKSTTADNADVAVTLENGEIIFRSTGDLFGLNVFVNANIGTLGTPQILNANMLSATNISSTNYAIGLATATTPTSGDVFMKIPFTAGINTSVTFDMIVNSTTKQVTVDMTTGVATINGKMISVYPNPVNSTLFVNGLTEKSKVTIYDLSGKMIFNQQINENQIDISKLSNGTYSIKIESANGIVTKKFVKQ